MLIDPRRVSFEMDDNARLRSVGISGGVRSPVEISLRLSLRNLDFRLKMAFPIACTLSGRSLDGMLLVVDLTDDFRDRVKESNACSQVCSQDGRRSCDAYEMGGEDPEEVVCSFTCRYETDDCFTLSLKARITAGEGGPSTAGSKKSA